MVIDYLDSARTVIRPHKTDPPLIIYTNAVLSLSIIFQCFKPICRRNPKIIQRLRLVQHEQFSQSDLLNITRQPARHFTVPDFLSFLGCKSYDHGQL